ISVNGKLTTKTVSNITSASDIVIGAYVNTLRGVANNEFSGSLDLVDLYDSLLGPSQITKLYNSDKSSHSSNNDCKKSGSDNGSNKSGCDNNKQGQLSHPSGVAVDISGNIYVADTNNNRIAVFDSSGKLLKSIVSKGSGPGEFSHPSGVAVDISGKIYFSDTKNNRKAEYYSSDKLLKSIGSKGSGPGEFSHPSGVAVDSICNIYVADTNNDRIQRITRCGVQHQPVV